MIDASPVAVFLGSYLVGSIPFGIVVGRVFFNTDIRQTGSGNIGAANALRAMGKVGGTVVLALDILKGTAPTLLVARSAPSLEVLAATAAILGHCFSPWLRFKGGKGVATALGALGVLCWQAAVVCVLAWIATSRLTRFSSVASMVGCAISIPTLWLLTADPAKMLFAVSATLFIIWRHRENIRRLREGRENRLFTG